MGDISGIFKNISIWCLNHPEPQKMEIVKNVEKMKSPFLGCTGHGRCPNRINLDDYTGVVYKFMDLMSEAAPAGDLTNVTFDYRGPRQKISCKVILYTKDDIRIGILNRTVMGR